MKVFDNGIVELWQGDCRDLSFLDDESVNCVVTSPPYWGLRDYGLEPLVWGGESEHDHEWGTERITTVSGGGWANPDTRDRYPTMRLRDPAKEPLGDVSQGAFCPCGAWRGSLGLEPTPDLYVEHIVEVFREVWRVLRKNGTLWLNLGDSYSHGGNGSRDADRWPKQARNADGFRATHEKKDSGLKPKDLVMMPARVALALQADGWWVRSDIIWSKPNPMPESVTDRPTRAHEYLFLVSKSERYYYNAEAIREPLAPSSLSRLNQHIEAQGGSERANGGTRASRPMKAVVPAGWDSSAGDGGHGSFHRNGRRRSGNKERKLDTPTRRNDHEATGFPWEDTGVGRNRRSVWEIPTQPYPEAHFATFPEALVEPCVLAGCPPDGLVLDPFVGSGTTCAVAQKLGRRAIGVDLSRDYLELAKRRLERIPLPLL